MSLTSCLGFLGGVVRVGLSDPDEEGVGERGGEVGGENLSCLYMLLTYTLLSFQLVIA